MQIIRIKLCLLSYKSPKTRNKTHDIDQFQATLAKFKCHGMFAANTLNYATKTTQINSLFRQEFHDSKHFFFRRNELRMFKDCKENYPRSKFVDINPKSSNLIQNTACREIPD